MLSSCSYLFHENPQKQGPFNYSKPPDNCSGTIPIVVHWSSGWHTSIVIPNKGLKNTPAFNDFPFIEANWGDKGFYLAGGDLWARNLAVFDALFLPSASVMYFVGIPNDKQAWCQHYNKPIETNHSQRSSTTVCSRLFKDIETIIQYYDGLQIWVTPEEFSAITQIVNDALKLDNNQQPIMIGNAFITNPDYSTAGRFFESHLSYFGLFETCNSWSANVLSEIDSLKTLKDSYVYRSETIFKFLHEQKKQGNACIRTF